MPSRRSWPRCASAATPPCSTTPSASTGCGSRPETCRSRPRRSTRPRPPASAADPRGLAEAAARIADFHRRQVPEDLDYRDDSGRAPGPPLDGARLRRALRARRHGGLSLLGVDERPAGQGRRRRAPGHGGADAGRAGRALGAGRAPAAGVDEIYRIGGAQAVAALAYGTESIAAGRQDRRARQRLRGGRQAPGLRHRRHRHDRRAVGDPGRRGRPTTTRAGSPPTCCPRPSTTRRPRPS